MTRTAAPAATPAAPAPGPETTSPGTTSPGTTAHLTPERWNRANRHLVRKAIAEFSHERILQPLEETGRDGMFRLTSDDGRAVYRFRATVLALQHWNVAAESIERTLDGAGAALDALDFITEFAGTLGINEQMLPVYLEEISSTLASAAFKDAPDAPDSGLLAAGLTGGADPAADFQAVERSMTEGHPCFVANNGRLGFGSGDYLAYAPEAGAPIRLEWIAVRADRTRFTAVAGMDYRRHLHKELGAATLAAFESALAAAGLDPAGYYYLPVHPWQWRNKLSVTFAADVANRHIVHLGTGEDTYQAQQSIRTFFNRSKPSRCYVKTALSVVNMGFMRGLSPEYMVATPAINDWLHGLVSADPALQAADFRILREVAAIGYTNRYYDAAAPKGSPYRKMLAALWRESPLDQLDNGEQLATMASLLHTDAAGTPFASALISRSGLPARQWLRRYLEAYLVPLLHCFYAYDLAFMPHGENLILVLRDGVPQRVFMKDIAEEIVVMGEKVELPEEVSRVRVQIPAEEKVLSLFTDVFDCFFRFLSALLHEDGILDQQDFWAEVAETVAQYQDAHPEFAGDFAASDLFAEDFVLSCLNRLQLRNNQQMLDLSDPSGGLQFSGRIPNPLAGFRPASRGH
ncbi:IucA/IucC family siderophore biosynthesis protein [Arthrobacter zhangbolii]|uniref:IucA/IucC family siderophore biosynthesis protein n=1 Tax=Arthrobacter zhangbolii TaxID=2886936 RepID=A0A9X1S9X4_9MICC|nr:IucA/IucC family siderophore biosynthesis protein [Arthrobacter zhangbolii]MCC3273613.1 IucA/IucC family siderophore biosynthesis protein [Arthrobacter zhangbolii]UON92421.1 IucA/IucC family siderophore biosynthesis protein [Arthrobacter zhangbolii]